jgi:hypothetical protein
VLIRAGNKEFSVMTHLKEGRITDSLIIRHLNFILPRQGCEIFMDLNNVRDCLTGYRQLIHTVIEACPLMVSRYIYA